ncbi:MAG TPA: adenylate/guanylate cyclase domain-containing protein [Candidatus Binatia bacterium]|jgi:adenylate cyclase|nr:adenylate/guanylate cyclase domain-containing protein [Candidatus Binatia bacterium]
MSHPTIDGLKRWLASQALAATPAERIANHTAETLGALGLPLWRCHVGMSALHPQVESIGVTWTRGGADLVETYGHGSFASIATTSPFHDAVTSAQRAARDGRGPEFCIPMTRYRLERGEGLHFSLLSRFRDAGGTDYVCFVAVFGTEGSFDGPLSGAAISFTTDRAGGFRDDEIAVLAEVMPPFATALRVAAHVTTTRSLLDVYLGRDVGGRVLNGEIRRGSVETITAAILVGDLRGFTTLADTTPSDVLVAMLDDHLEALVGAVEERGGQVLKFLGDGLLATFSTHGPRRDCADALDAAVDALDRTESLRQARGADGRPVAALDLALHAGDVLYGNVGSDRRLDFTVVGPAVNETARLELLCSVLDVPLVASGRFVEHVGAPERFRSLGTHALRGVRLPAEVFTIASA